MSDRVTLWTLQREGATTSAEMCHVDGAWLELRYLHNDEVVARQRFQDGSELFPPSTHTADRIGGRRLAAARTLDALSPSGRTARPAALAAPARRGRALRNSDADYRLRPASSTPANARCWLTRSAVLGPSSARQTSERMPH
jgi:hypothetical protein